MPIRGLRPIMPKRGKAPTGIFSTRGKQKMDSTSKFPAKGDMSYAKGCSTRTKPRSSMSKNVRHLSPGGNVPMAK